MNAKLKAFLQIGGYFAAGVGIGLLSSSGFRNKIGNKIRQGFIAIGDDKSVIVIRRSDEPPVQIKGYEVVDTTKIEL